MKYIMPLLFGLCGAISLPVQAQQLSPWKFSVGFNPIFHQNFSKSSNTELGNMKDFTISAAASAYVSYKLSPRFSLSTGIKYSWRTQKLRQSQFYDYLSNESYSYINYKYENLDFPLFIQYKVYKNIYAIGGVALSNYNLSIIEYGHHYRGTSSYNGGLDISYQYTPQDYAAWKRGTNILVGMNLESPLKVLRRLDVGLLLTLRPYKMPEYNYHQELQTDDKGVVTGDVNYQSTQHSAEITLSYNFGKGLSKRNKK